MKFTRIAATLAWLFASPALASQATLVTPGTPLPMSSLATFLDNALLSIGSCNAGNSAPANGTGAAAFAGECWINTTSNPWVFSYTADATHWSEFGTLNTSTYVWTPYNALVPGNNLSDVSSAATALNNLFGTVAANKVWAGPASGSAADPTMRALVGADLPAPGASSLGGVESVTSVAHEWIAYIDTSGVPHQSQPAFSDISGTAANSQIPVPTASALGGIESIVSAAHNWIAYIDTSGVPHQSQPAFSDISGSLAPTQCPTFTSVTIGCVPASGGGNTTYLRADGTFAAPSGSGNVSTSDSSSTAGDVVQEAGTSGTTVHDSGKPAAALPTAVGQLPGTTTNDSASAGNVGEYVSASVASGSAVSLTTSAAKNITSISLTAGDWDVSGVVSFTGASSTVVSTMLGIISLSTNSATPNDAMGFTQQDGFNATPFTYSGSLSYPVGPTRISLASTTTIYLNAEAGFGTSTMSAYGMIRARRRR